MKTEQRLKCVGCGRKAKVILHGTSYCQSCAFKGLNKPAIQTSMNSPIEREAKRQEPIIRKALKDVRSDAAWGPYSWALTGMSLRQAKNPRKVRRNLRRRALRKQRARTRVSGPTS